MIIQNGVLKQMAASGHGIINIPVNVTEIERFAFSYRDDIRSVYIPNTVTSIGEGAFRGCSNLETVTFEEGCKLRNIEAYTFEECSNLTEIILPDGIENICFEAFVNCSSLTSISFPRELGFIADRAFIGCFNLMNISFPKGIMYVSNQAFDFEVEHSNDATGKYVAYFEDSEGRPNVIGLYRTLQAAEDRIYEVSQITHSPARACYYVSRVARCDDNLIILDDNPLVVI